jgi:hypothetical protein
VSGGHGHADLLSVQAAVFGEPVIVDPGTYAYTADADWRNYFRSSTAHSTVTVDGVDQAVPSGPFKWRERPRATLRRWISNNEFDVADASHDAFHSLPDPVTHRRRVFFSKPRYWMIVDDLHGALLHRVDLRYQFAPMQVVLSADSWAVARTPGGRECRMLTFATTPLTATLVEAQLEPIQGWISPDYGKREAAPTLTFSATTQLPLRIVTLLFPAESALVSYPIVSASSARDRIEVMFENDMETLNVGEDDISLTRVTQPDQLVRTRT